MDEANQSRAQYDLSFLDSLDPLTQFKVKSKLAVIVQDVYERGYEDGMLQSAELLAIWARSGDLNIEQRHALMASNVTLVRFLNEYLNREKMLDEDDLAGLI